MGRGPDPNAPASGPKSRSACPGIGTGPGWAFPGRAPGDAPLCRLHPRAGRWPRQSPQAGDPPRPISTAARAVRGGLFKATTRRGWPSLRAATLPGPSAPCEAASKGAFESKPGSLSTDVRDPGKSAIWALTRAALGHIMPRLSARVSAPGTWDQVGHLPPDARVGEAGGECCGNAYLRKHRSSAPQWFCAERTGTARLIPGR